jgi:hypothetical protein
VLTGRAGQLVEWFLIPGPEAGASFRYVPLLQLMALMRRIVAFEGVVAMVTEDSCSCHMPLGMRH